MRKLINRLICFIKGHDYTEMEWTDYGGGLDMICDCYCKRCGKHFHKWIYYGTYTK